MSKTVRVVVELTEEQHQKLLAVAKRRQHEPEEVLEDLLYFMLELGVDLEKVIYIVDRLR